RKQILERDLGASFLAQIFGFLGALFGEDARALLIFNSAELDARFGDTIEAQQLHGYRRPSFFEAVAFFINQGANLAPELPTNDDVAHVQSPFAHQHSRGWT